LQKYSVSNKQKVDKLQLF